MIALSAVVPTATVVPIPTPNIQYGDISPLLLVLGVALVGVAVEAFADSRIRNIVQPILAAGGFAVAFGILCYQGDHLSSMRGVKAMSAVDLDGPGLFMQGTILVLAILSVLLVAERKTGSALVEKAALLPGFKGAQAMSNRDGAVQTEAYPLMVFAVSGMMLFATAQSLLVMFIALEILSLPLYLMAGLARRRRLLSQEAALKYFLLGAFSSAIFLYGLALLYGYAGSVDLTAIHNATQDVHRNDLLLYTGMGLLGVGLLFKVSAVPFHSWTPDVYQGSPTPVTAFMAAGTKVAAFGAILRLFFVGFGVVTSDWRPFFWVIAILTMLVGAVLAVTQTDVKRMLAYSSIAHAGFILVAVAGSDTTSISSVMFYLVCYGFTTIAAFAIVTLVRDGEGEATHLSRWQGLARRSPVVASSFALVLLALAGIPLTSGFTAKFAVFSAAVKGGATPLVIVGVLASAIAGFFYARVIVLMFFAEPKDDDTYVAVPGIPTAVALAVGLGVTVALGVVPGRLLQLASDSGVFVR